MQDPATYDRNEISIRDTAEFLPKISSSMEWKEQEVVLDYGCGPGRTGYLHLLPRLEAHNSFLQSVDVSPSMIEFARVNYAHERIGYSVGNIFGEFPFGEETFDKIFAIHLLHHVADIRFALKRFWQILKPGGQLGFIMFPREFMYFEVFKRIAETESWRKYMKNYSQFLPLWSTCPDGNYRKMIADLMEDSGFEVTLLQVEDREWIYTSTEIGLDAFISLNPFLGKIPIERISELRKDYWVIITQLLKIPLNSEWFKMPYKTIVCTVKRCKSC